MIFDKLENWNHYFAGVLWQQVADYLNALPPDTVEGEYPIKGKEIFARVMSYETVDPAKAVFEAHHDYIDIQSVLVGGEGIAWHPADGLTVQTKYDAEKDVEFFRSPKLVPARVNVLPGYFAVLFSHDAHMPQLHVNGMLPHVKKVVIKVRRNLYSACSCI